MVNREKIDTVLASMGKMVSNLQQTSLDEFVHSVKYNFDYYRIHARLNYYSNSRNPRVIHTKLKNQKLTSLRTNPHDPFFVRPGEFLTLAKKEPEDNDFDEILEYYNNARPRGVHTAPTGSRQLDGELRELHTKSNNSDRLFGSRRIGSEFRQAGLKDRSLGVRFAQDYHQEEEQHKSPASRRRQSSTGKSTYCPVHLVPHPMELDVDFTRRMHVRSTGSLSPVNMCEHQRQRPEKRALKTFNTFKPVEKEFVIASTFIEANGGSSQRTGNGYSGMPQHQENIRQERSRNLANGIQVHEKKRIHSHATEIAAFVNGQSDSKLAMLEPEAQVTRKIRRKLVRKPKKYIETRQERPKSDGSIAHADASSNLIELSSHHEEQTSMNPKRKYCDSLYSAMKQSLNSQVSLRPKSGHGSRRSLMSGSREGKRTASSGAKPSSHSRSQGGLSKLDYDHSGLNSSQQRLSHRNGEGRRRPSSTRNFRASSLRAHQKDSQCHCSTCDETKVWQLVLSDISLLAARLSTGSDGGQRERSRSSQKRKRDVFEENLRQGMAHYHSLPTMLFLDSMDDWYN